MPFAERDENGVYVKHLHICEYLSQLRAGKTAAVTTTADDTFITSANPDETIALLSGPEPLT